MKKPIDLEKHLQRLQVKALEALVADPDTHHTTVEECLAKLAEPSRQATAADVNPFPPVVLRLLRDAMDGNIRYNDVQYYVPPEPPAATTVEPVEPVEQPAKQPAKAKAKPAKPKPVVDDDDYEPELATDPHERAMDRMLARRLMDY